jgi:hypothetical protein
VERYHLDELKLWKQIIDHNYRIKRPNLFAFPGLSPFWKGVMWPAKADKWGINGNLEMGKRSSSGRITELGPVV